MRSYSYNKQELSFLQSSVPFFKDIKLAHSVFALPFAAVALLMIPLPENILSIAPFLLICMVSARSFAMGMNRYLDRHIDRLNPRTADRLIPNGTLNPKHGLAWSLLMGLVFLGSAASISSVVGLLGLPLLVILAAYSLMKRFTYLTHWYLGFCLGLAPIAVSVALTSSVSFPIIFIGIAVMMWTAGFDILYSLQDQGFDRNEKLHSIPSKFGASAAVYISRISFLLMLGSLIVSGIMANFGTSYYLGLGVIALFLAYEHWLVRDVLQYGYSKNINKAFFNVNAWVGILFFVVVQIELLLS
ncbi:MAG: 4-hydroxybenzoate octaprenyltransferase [Oligoflexales bacterium]|nr:4-hydroxybenzoate octaprenyltransferase [Oligoflexales bacterium]